MLNRPPINEDLATSAWQNESTDTIIRLEQRLDALLLAIKKAADLADLKERVRKL